MRKANMAHHRRMTVFENQAYSASSSHSQRIDHPQVDPIYLSDDEEDIPPPPPLILTTDKRAEVEDTLEEIETEEPPPPPKLNEKSVSLDELHISLEDLKDPLIEEFVRSYCGAMHEMIDVRPITPPSPPPPSSPSSIDWESEDFRPPTPPRRRMFGTLDIEDRQYLHLGMPCYERVWRARILLPGAKPRSAPIEPAPFFSRYQDTNMKNPQVESPVRQGTFNELPITPGRGWLAQASVNDGMFPEDTDGLSLFAAKTHSQSPPSREATTPPPRVSIGDEALTLEQLPIALQQEVAEKRKTHRGTRTRFTRTIQGQQYRVTISRNGAVRITQS